MVLYRKARQRAALFRSRWRSTDDHRRASGAPGGLTARAGLETEVLEEKFVKRNGNTQYWRTSNYTVFDEPVLFRWAFNKQGQIVGMGLGPASDAPPIDP